MPKITVLPSENCPQGATLEAQPGERLLEVLLKNGIEIEHACEMQCACTTCHIYVREGADDVNAPEEQEEDMLDKAWGLDVDSRLSCQVYVGEQDLIVEIPKYTLNQVAENTA